MDMKIKLTPAGLALAVLMYLAKSCLHMTVCILPAWKLHSHAGSNPPSLNLVIR